MVLASVDDFGRFRYKIGAMMRSKGARLFTDPRRVSVLKNTLPGSSAVRRCIHKPEGCVRVGIPFRSADDYVVGSLRIHLQFVPGMPAQGDRQPLSELQLLFECRRTEEKRENKEPCYSRKQFPIACTHAKPPVRNATGRQLLSQPLLETQLVDG